VLNMRRLLTNSYEPDLTGTRPMGWWPESKEVLWIAVVVLAGGLLGLYCGSPWRLAPLLIVGLGLVWFAGWQAFQRGTLDSSGGSRRGVLSGVLVCDVLRGLCQQPESGRECVRFFPNTFLRVSWKHFGTNAKTSCTVVRSGRNALQQPCFSPT